MSALRLIMWYKLYWGVSRGTQWWMYYRFSYHCRKNKMVPMSWCVMDGEMQNKRFHDLVFMEGLSEQWERRSVNPSPSLLGYDLSFSDSHKKKKEKEKTPTSLYILNPQPCQIPLKYDSILFHYPFWFLVSFVSASHMIYLQWSHFLPTIRF